MLRHLLRLILLSIIPLASLSCWKATVNAKDARPNFLLILTDDQRFDALHAAGCKEIITPTMDRLAREGTSFTQASIMVGTRAAVCVPSRAMLLTGTSVYRFNGIIPQESTTLPQLLAQHGYATFISGKWHNDKNALLRSFEYGKEVFVGGMGSHFKTPVSDIRHGELTNDRVAREFDSELFADATIDFLESRPEDRPFFAFLSFCTPHDPRKVPDEYHQMYDAAEIPLPPNFLPEHPFDNGHLRIRDEKLAGFPRDPDEVRQHIADYYAATTATDEHIGRVLNALDELGLDENTIVIFAGDNGLAVGQHGLMGKQNLYEHSIRVPLILRGPGVPRAMRSGALCLLSDLYPTVAAMAGLPVPESVDGKDLSPVLHGTTKDIRNATFHVYKEFQRAVRTRDTKLIEYFVDGTGRRS